MNDYVPFLTAALSSCLAIVGQHLSRQRTQRIDELADVLKKLPEGPSRAHVEQAIQYETSKLKTRDDIDTLSAIFFKTLALALGGFSLIYLGSYLAGATDPQWNAIAAIFLICFGGILLFSGPMLLIFFVLASIYRKLNERRNSKDHVEIDGPTEDH